MIEIKGKHNSAKIFNDNVEQMAVKQIINLCNQEAFKDAKIRIMPDVHAGAGCVIGFSADLGRKVIPNIVGVDIGCGMLTVDLGTKEIDLEWLDEIIKRYVPSGFNVHKEKQTHFDLTRLKCFRELQNTPRILRSIGTLGGGNHFIEIGQALGGTNYLIIHTGSRNLGKQVADYYQKLAIELHSGKEGYFKQRDALIEEYKAAGRKSEIKGALEKLQKQFHNQKPDMPKDLCYLEGKYAEDYLNDMRICQEYADLNRMMIAKTILARMTEKTLFQHDYFQTVHNYINFEDNIVRKGAIQAKEGQKVLIPMNMRDGSILGIGKGNDEWNQTAPHGAGRLMSRSQAKRELSMEEFKETMGEVYTTSVVESTLDEAPMAYKPMEEIMENIEETVDIVKILKPIYNYKAH